MFSYRSVQIRLQTWTDGQQRRRRSATRQKQDSIAQDRRRGVLRLSRPDRRRQRQALIGGIEIDHGCHAVGRCSEQDVHERPVDFAIRNRRTIEGEWLVAVHGLREH